ncbi:MAG: hypothetical protein K0S53_504 [Bacteroidetes bacterium]|jgi:hypothetical protein|nr:hypothetical protein [Bacteroidota bacterium]MDF2451870.1 hypothetical protein [Bacteroidota bacterium]
MALNVTFFNHLCLFDQMDIIHRHGEYITTIKECKNIINLHLVDDAFVEVYYHEKYAKVRFVRVIHLNDKRFDLYSDQVNLEDLYTAKT